MSAAVVKKGTEEFKAAHQQYLKLFFESKKGDFIRRGIFDAGEHKGKYLGETSRKILEAKLPMPFGCPDLFIQPCIKEKQLKGVIWFCDRIGCLCSCCREDMTKPSEEYPTNCPQPDIYDPDEDFYDPEDDEEWWTEEDWW